MNLLNAKNIENENYDVVRYYFEVAKSEDDIRIIMSILQMQGYEFTKYEVHFEHDHTEVFSILKCDDIESLLYLMRENGFSNVSKIDLYGNVIGTFFPNEGIINIVAQKKNRTR